jgi:hypothetical protein
MAGLVAACALSGATGAGAANFGSAVIVTYRSCSAVTSADACDGNGPGQQILWPAGSPFGPGVPPYGPSVLTGGEGFGSSTSFTNSDGSSSAAFTFNTPNSEPVFTGSTSSLGDVRLGSDGVAFYTYTNTGGVAVALTLGASVGWTSSSTSPASTSTANGQDLPGGAEYNAFVAIVDPSYLNAQLSGPTSAAYGTGLTGDNAFDYDLIFGLLPGTACGVGGVDAYGSALGATTGGGGSDSVSSSACGGGGAYDVAPGQTVIILDGYQLISNRGGEIDPFTMQFTDAPTPNSLTTPEPATWALMLSGVGLVGGALRRRVRLAKLTA